MHKFILIPDSFKGTMSSTEICAVMETAIRRYLPDAQVCGVPVADGGEGSVDAFLGAVGGEKVAACVQGPWGEDVDAFYGALPGGVAVIEMAAAAGLPLVGERRSAEQTTTYGVGQLMRLALERGCKKNHHGPGRQRDKRRWLRRSRRDGSSVQGCRRRGVCPGWSNAFTHRLH